MQLARSAQHQKYMWARLQIARSAQHQQTYVGTTTRYQEVDFVTRWRHLVVSIGAGTVAISTVRTTPKIYVGTVAYSTVRTSCGDFGHDVDSDMQARHMNPSALWTFITLNIVPRRNNSTQDGVFRLFANLRTSDNIACLWARLQPARSTRLEHGHGGT